MIDAAATRPRPLRARTAAASPSNAPRPQQARRPWLGRARQAGRHDLDPCGRRWSSGCSRPRRPATPARSIRSRPAALPIALGEATKTVPFVMDGRKAYRFTVRWGEERDTDDAEGQRRSRPATARPRTAGSRPCCRASPARSSRCRRNFPPSRSTASAPMISPATARPSSSRRGPVEIDALRIVSHADEPRHSRPNAARAAMCAPSPGTSASPAGTSTMSPMRTTGSAPSRSPTPSQSTSCARGRRARRRCYRSRPRCSLIPEVVVHRVGMLRLKRGPACCCAAAMRRSSSTRSIDMGGVLVATGSCR